MLVAQQFAHTFVAHIKEFAEEGGLQILRYRQVEHDVERIGGLFGCKVGNGAVLQIAVFFLCDRADKDLIPGTLEDRADNWVFQIFAKMVSEPRTFEDLRQLLWAVRLDVRKGLMAEERVGIRHGEIEGQRLTRDLDIELVAAFLGGSAIVKPTATPVGITGVVHSGAGGQEHAASDLLDDRLHRLHSAAPSSRHLNDAFTRVADRFRQMTEFIDCGDGRRHRNAAMAHMIDGE